MTPLVLALALAGQYPTPQAPQYGAPAQYSAPVITGAPGLTAYAAPVTYAAPQVVMLGAGQVIQPSPFGMMLGHIGRKLEKHSWPRVQPMTMSAPATMQQTVYLQMSQPVVQSRDFGIYTVAQPTYQAPVQYAAPPTYGAPQPPAKAPPTQTYGSPQGGQYGAPQQQQAQSAQLGASKPNESVPPVPPR
jgi:hypothetical protein